LERERYLGKLRRQKDSEFVFPATTAIKQMSQPEKDELFMRVAVMLAKNCTPYANRNLTTEAYPCVGAVIVSNDQIVAASYKGQKFFPFNKSTTAHAEYIAFKTLARQGRAESCVDATVYSTLEPCSYRNPHNTSIGKMCCCDHIIRNKVKRVVIGQIDPDPHVSGKGVSMLENAGIEVVNVATFHAELDALNAPFILSLKRRLVK
jgi:diaminohydroxyphosphoribosylaminopyrimidine deaminase/5-amino-6-(5-phosphoribosylamino)uracil reductase